MTHPIRPSFPFSHSLPSGSSHKPLILTHQRADRMKNKITENWPNWSHGPQPCLAQWNYEPCRFGPPKMEGSWWRVLTKCPLEKGIANHISILVLKPSYTVWKGKKIWHWKMKSPGLWVPNMLLEINFQMFRVVLEKAEKPENKLPTSAGSSKKQEGSRKNIYFCFIDYAKAFDCGSQ